MKWVADITSPVPVHFVIEQSMLRDVASGEEVPAYYIYVLYKDGSSKDYMQDTLELAQDFVREEFNVPVTAWRLENGSQKTR